MIRKNLLYFVVILIGILLITDIVLTNYNNSVIRNNKETQKKIEGIKKYYDQIGKSVIHSIDLGLRGYAIVQTDEFASPLYNGINWKDSIVSHVENPLREFKFDLSEFHVFKDSLNAYAKYGAYLKQLLESGRVDDFKQKFSSDKGGYLWWQYLMCERSIAAFLNRIDENAQKEYEAALLRNQILQIIIFLICFPTLLYTAFHTSRAVNLLQLLRKTEAEKIEIIKEQNARLEKKVAERTNEIATVNEEITLQSEEMAAQRDALAVQNRQFQEAQKIIENQNQEIQMKNNHLEAEVENRTMELRSINQELIQQNNQLEQFAFIAAHNLRAPLARILGLANILEISLEEKDKNNAIAKIVSSSHDLDRVIRDLSIILEIKKYIGNLVEVSLPDAFNHALQTLEKVTEQTHAKIIGDFRKASLVKAIPPYVESIFYNLISNAIKYSDPDRTPEIVISTMLEENYVCLLIKDNGLGIDLSKHQQSVFGLYKRFHLHMEGKGLGLYMVKTQIIAMGGKIEISSELNKGTVFRVYFKK